MKRGIVLFLTIASLFSAAVLPTQAWGNCAQFYTVRPGDTLASIASMFGTNFPYLASINGLSNPNRIFWGMTICVRSSNPQPPPPPPQHHSTFYVVQPGDWLSRIAQRFGISYFSLLRANPLMNPNLIFPGEVLTIPRF